MPANEHGVPRLRQCEQGCPGMSMTQRDRRWWQRAHAGYRCDPYGRAVFISAKSIYDWKSTICLDTSSRKCF